MIIIIIIDIIVVVSINIITSITIIITTSIITSMLISEAREPLGEHADRGGHRAAAAARRARELREPEPRLEPAQREGRLGK